MMRAVSDLPPPDDPRRPVATLIEELDARLGRERFVEVCVALLEGAPRTAYAAELRYLAGRSFGRGDVPDPTSWKDYWLRTWGARGLLHCWHDRATSAVVAGLGDEHYRPAEMCLKVSAAHEVAGAAPGAAALAGHELPRVRVVALRTLGVVGDVEHADVVRAALEDPEEQVRVAAERSLRRLESRLDLPPSSMT